MVGLADDSGDVLFSSAFRNFRGENADLPPLLAVPPLLSIGLKAPEEGNENLDSFAAFAV